MTCIQSFKARECRPCTWTFAELIHSVPLFSICICRIYIVELPHKRTLLTLAFVNMLYHGKGQYITIRSSGLTSFFPGSVLKKNIMGTHRKITLGRLLNIESITFNPSLPEKEMLCMYVCLCLNSHNVSIISMIFSVLLLLSMSCLFVGAFSLSICLQGAEVRLRIYPKKGNARSCLFVKFRCYFLIREICRFSFIFFLVRFMLTNRGEWDWEYIPEKQC